MKQSTKTRLWSIGLGVLVPVVVLASNLTLPYSFTPGTPIHASEVNANFAAVQAAVNSKLDADAGVFRSGSRLVSFGFASTDGLRYPVSSFFDTVLGAYCGPGIATDSTLRCLPAATYAFSFFSDATCTTWLNVPTTNPSASYPSPTWRVPTATYVSTAPTDGGAGTEIHNAVLFTGQVYTYGSYVNDAGVPMSGCVPTTVTGQMLYTAGTIVPPTNMAQFNVVEL
jgi:hypothetical protein